MKKDGKKNTGTIITLGLTVVKSTIIPGEVQIPREFRGYDVPVIGA